MGGSFKICTRSTERDWHMVPGAVYQEGAHYDDNAGNRTLTAHQAANLGLTVLKRSFPRDVFRLVYETSRKEPAT